MGEAKTEKMSAKSRISCNCFPDAIRDHTEWRVLSAAEVDNLNRIAVCREYRPGQMIFAEGDECKGVYFIKQGLIGVRKEDIGGESVLLRLAHDGDTLGYRPFLAGERHMASAEVLKPSLVCFINTATMWKYLHDIPDFGMAFMRRASRELGAAERRFYETVTMNVRSRLAHLLLVMKERYGTTTPEGKLLIEIPISRHDMAEMIGVRSESLSRSIRQMTDDGVVNFSGHKVWIDDVDRLFDELSPYLEFTDYLDTRT